MDAALGMTVSRVKWSLWTLFTPVVAGVKAASIFHQACMGPFHKPDHGYPAAGVVSSSGKFHLVYFAAQIAVATRAIGFLTSGRMNKTSAGIGLLGGVVFIVAFVLDIKSGRFASLKPAKKQ